MSEKELDNLNNDNNITTTKDSGANGEKTTTEVSAAKKPAAKKPATASAAKKPAAKKTAAKKTASSPIDVKKSSVANKKKLAAKRAALEKRPVSDDEFGLKLFLQPVFSPRDKTVFGYECMPRIVDRELGVLTPGMFLDVAKKNPALLNGLETWTLTELFKIALQFRQKKKYIEMLSLNIDLSNMSRADFVDKVEGLIDKHTESIYFELDEDVFFSKDPIVVENIQKLKALEIGIAVNDFSSDFLTFEWSGEIPFSIIKLDKTYIDLFLVSPKAKAIVAKMVEFSKNNNITLVAVGVETREQEKALLELGIDKMQGYYYAKPMSLFNIFNEEQEETKTSGDKHLQRR